MKLVRFLLAEQELDIHSAASDPQSGVDLIRRFRPQIVLLDLVMPGVQGMELLQQIVEFDPSIDVILMTGYYSTESAVEAIQKGACDYLPKPFSPAKNFSSGSASSWKMQCGGSAVRSLRTTFWKILSLRE